MANPEDPFEDVLNLEEQFYQDGYKQGQADGVKAGRIEGRSLGLEKGFQKFVESGRLYGRAIVWANRLPSAIESRRAQEPMASLHRQTTNTEPTEGVPAVQETQRTEQLPALPHNPRLQKHITTLYALVESESLSTENTDEAVNDFDDRLKRAEGKAKVIERLVGEAHATESGKAHETPGANKAKLEV
ncbi:hypothetical protein QBC47DRAFT_377841 [Echria macrotheca]|uniref:Essential protein Yae1 N-terminal domain-containing protein n=1 Tax=Echria macrotheca TaxID=438768 RepID=A0AAJ0FCT1_9PEZI|nr:hypothetical protein QBC47DRAFT_377841 [Echria macrotheca]